MLTVLRAHLESPFKRWLDHWHGVPPDPVRQRQFYRCEGCKGIVTWYQIAQGGCDCGIGSRVRAASLTWHEKVRLLVFPWSV